MLYVVRMQYANILKGNKQVCVGDYYNTHNIILLPYLMYSNLFSYYKSGPQFRSRIVDHSERVNSSGDLIALLNR